MKRIAVLDLRLLRAAAGVWGAFLVVITGGLSAGVTGFFVPLLTVPPVMVTMSLLGAIETAKLTQMFGVLPVGRAQVVRGHYLIALGACLVTVVPWLVAVAAHGVDPSLGVAPGDLWGWTAALGGMLVALSVMIPLVVKWGSNKGMLILVQVFAAIVLLVAALSRVVALPSGELPDAGAVGVLAIGLAAMAVSLVVTTRIYERQDH